MISRLVIWWHASHLKPAKRLELPQRFDRAHIRHTRPGDAMACSSTAAAARAALLARNACAGHQWPRSATGPALAAALPSLFQGTVFPGGRTAQRRGVATSAGTTGAAVPRRGSLLEVREYTLAPAGMKDYLAMTAEHAELRSRLLPFLG